MYSYSLTHRRQDLPQRKQEKQSSSSSSQRHEMMVINRTVEDNTLSDIVHTIESGLDGKCWLFHDVI